MLPQILIAIKKGVFENELCENESFLKKISILKSYKTTDDSFATRDKIFDQTDS